MDTTITVDEKTYSIVANEFEPGHFSLGVCEVAADGGPGRVIVDPDAAEETFIHADACIMAGIQVVL
jgi:hypothetical protein